MLYCKICHGKENLRPGLAQYSQYVRWRNRQQTGIIKQKQKVWLFQFLWVKQRNNEMIDFVMPSLIFPILIFRSKSQRGSEGLLVGVFDVKSILLKSLSGSVQVLARVAALGSTRKQYQQNDDGRGYQGQWLICLEYKNLIVNDCFVCVFSICWFLLFCNHRYHI